MTLCTGNGCQNKCTWYQEMCCEQSVETTRRHEPECLILHIQYRENLKTHTMRIWMFSSQLPQLTTYMCGHELSKYCLLCPRKVYEG